MLDTEALERINALAKQTEAAVNAHAMRNATELFQKTQVLIGNETNNVDFYNILKKSGSETSQEHLNTVRAKKFESPYIGKHNFMLKLFFFLFY